ncbi:hypothetical protein Hanom_Chr12g01114831 [Helianthus anomalus]
MMGDLITRYGDLITNSELAVLSFDDSYATRSLKSMRTKRFVASPLGCF